MRLSSLFSTIALIIGFLSTLTPACFYIAGGPDNIIAMSWIELQESPVLWIYLAALFIVMAQDIEVLNGIDFLRKSNMKFIRLLLLTIGFFMAFSLELSVNVYYSQGPTFWKEVLLLQRPSDPTIRHYASVAYYLMRICRIIILSAFILELFDRYTPNYYRKIAISARQSYTESDN